MNREQIIEDVKRRLNEYQTAPFDERPYTDYALSTSLVRDIQRLLDALISDQDEINRLKIENDIMSKAVKNIRRPKFGMPL